MLQGIKNRKDVLFCRFDDVKDGKRRKVEAWEEIRKTMEANGYVKPYSYLRDTDWSNLRSRTLAKRDKNNKTGAEPQIFDEIYNLVFDIIGKETPVVAGLAVSESMSVSQSHGDGFSFVQELHKASQPAFLSTPLANEGNGEGTSYCETRRPTPIRKRKMLSLGSRETDRLKERRIRLQNRKLELEILKLESELPVDHIDI